MQIDYGPDRAFGKVVITNRLGSSEEVKARAVGMSITLSAEQCDNLSSKSNPDCSGVELWTEKLKVSVKTGTVCHRCLARKVLKLASNPKSVTKRE